MAMAFRAVARRSPASPSAALVRELLRSGRQQTQQMRAYADEYTGKGLDEREKAAENRYIRQMEEQRKLKKGPIAEADARGDIPVSPSGEVPQTKGFFSTGAIVAGIAVIVAGWWFTSGSKKEEEESQ